MRRPADHSAVARTARQAIDALAVPAPGEGLEPSRTLAAGSGAGRLAVLAANLLIILAGAAVSIVPRVALTYHVFLAFLAGHAIWMGYAVTRGDRGLGILNAGLIALDCYAIAIRVL